MRIAVTSQNFRSVTGHAGRARRFIVFEVGDKGTPQEIERLDLEANMTIHGFDPRSNHPLDNMKVLITAGSGEGFIRHMAARGVQVVATAESDPAMAVAAYLAGRVISASGNCHQDQAEIGDGFNDHGDDRTHECSCRS